MNAKEQVNAEGKTILRIAAEFRDFLSQCGDEPEAVSLLRDIDILERVGSWLAHTSPIETTGLLAAGSTEKASEPTCS